MRLKIRRRLPILYLLSAFLLTMLPLSAFAQGSIFGTVTNSDASTPANGEVTFFGFLDDTDEELRIETSTGAGYDAGNWFDDFQNYLTEAPGNPYDYYFFNTANGEGAHLANLIPNNSFQQENIALAAVTWPTQPVGLTATVVSSSSLVLEWNGTPGVTYHVYRRAAASNGSFFRLDAPGGVLTNPGTADSFFVDNTVDGVSSYDYLVIAQDGSGNYSQHSNVVTISSAALAAPTVASITPNSGFTVGGTAVTITGTGFDMSGALAFVGSSPLTNVVVVSPYEITGTTGTGTAGAATVTVTNVASSQSGSLPGGFTYIANSPPVLAAIGPQSVTENALLTINASATDADGDFPVMTTSALPPGAAFLDNGDGTATVTWTPTFLQSGVYNVTFYATDAVQPTFVDSEQVVITVNDAGNQLPVLAAIGPQGTTENVLLSFAVSATDAESTPVLGTSTLPGTAAFLDNGDGTGTFNWTPSFADAGIYDITFYATDDSLAVDSEIVTVTVTDAGNQPPVLATIGPRSTTENQQLLFSVSATDADGTTPTLSTSTLPGTATFTDNLDGTGSFDWTPSFQDAGTYDVTFYATDGVATDSEIVTITVQEVGNQAPVLAAIGAQGTTEGVLLNFTMSATDPDGTVPTFSSSALPGTATFVDNGDGTATFDWTPAFNTAGSYQVTFRATDGALTDSETVTITVLDAGNQAPVLAAIGPQNGQETVLLTFGVSATDPDGTTPSLLTSALPGTATFLDNGDGTGTFTWTPGYTDAGIYDVSFFATDGAALDTEVVTITIADAGNQPPVLDPIGPQATSENVQLLFTVTASDLDGTIPVLSTSALPGTATFNDNLDGTGTFDWTPAPTMAGVYDVTFYADDGIATDSEIVTITVTDVNQPPVLAAIGPQTVDEGVVMTFPVTATDVDGDFAVLTTTTLPPGASFVDNLDGTGTFTWATTFTDAGVYNVTFYATDGAVPTAIDSEAVVLTVNNVNQIPELLPIGTQSVAEGALVAFTVSATDLDGDIPLLTSTALPGTATYVDNLDGTGTFNWQTDFSSAGVYSVTFYATDALYPTAIDSEVVSIVVGEVGNQPPQWTQINDTTIAEGATLVLNVAAFDYEGNAISLSVNTTLQNYTFVDNGDGTGVLTYTPDYYDAGMDSVRFIATDDAVPPLSKIMKIAVTTTEGNQPPTFVQVGPFGVDALDSLIFNVQAFDSTNQDSSGRLYLSVTDLPANAAFTDNEDNTGTYRFAPTLAQIGVDTVHFLVVDDGTPARSSTMAVVVTVRNVDQAPILDPIGPQVVLEGGTLVVNLSATDPDGTIPFFEVINAPPNSNLVDNGDGTGVWTFNPSFVQSGLKYVTFRANDGEKFDKEVVVVQVGEAGDQSPYFSVLPSPTVLEGESTTDTVVALDPDGQIPTISVDPTTLPTNMTFSSIGDGMGEFIFAPDFTQSGTYPVTVIATAGALADTSIMTFTVQEFGNHDPVMDPLTDQTVTELTNLAFTVTASDIDGVAPVLSTSALPTNATFDPGTGAFSWTPAIDQQGDYPLTFYAYDGDAAFPNSADSQQITVTVVDTNRTPFVIPLPAQNQDVDEGGSLQFVVTAVDPDGTTPTLSAHLDGLDTLATNMVFVDSGNGVGVLTFSPDAHQGDPSTQLYYVRFVAADELDPTLTNVSPTTTFTVHNVPLPPSMTFSLGTGPLSVTEGGSLSFTVTAVDPDNAGIPTITVQNAPLNATYSQSINTLTFTFNPDFTQAGTYSVRFIAIDPSFMADTVDVQIDVIDAGNQAPSFTGTYPPTQGVYVGVVSTLNLTASDPDGDSIVISAASTLLGWNLVDNGDGTAQFIIDPDFGDVNTTQSVTFTVTDVPGGTGESFVIDYQVLSFMRGDIDGNAKYTINDVIYLANYLFRGGPAPSPIDAGDADMNGLVQVADAVYMINFLYNAGPRPPQ